jgi:hypothetical protein
MIIKGRHLKQIFNLSGALSSPSGTGNSERERSGCISFIIPAVE